MKQNRYKKTNLTRHIWLGLAVFLLVFNSTPVKKFIRLCLNQHSIVYNTPFQQVGNPYVKDCTLMERHTASSEIGSDIQQHSGLSDLDSSFALSLLITAVGLFFAAAYRRPAAHPVYARAALGNMPVYLRHHRLQV